MRQVESGEQGEPPTPGQERRTHYQQEIRVVERVSDVTVRPLQNQPLRNPVIIGDLPRRKQCPGEEEPGPTHLETGPRSDSDREDQQYSPDNLKRNSPAPPPREPPRGQNEDEQRSPAPKPDHLDQVPGPNPTPSKPATPKREDRIGNQVYDDHTAVESRHKERCQHPPPEQRIPDAADDKGGDPAQRRARMLLPARTDSHSHADHCTVIGCLLAEMLTG